MSRSQTCSLASINTNMEYRTIVVAKQISVIAWNIVMSRYSSNTLKVEKQEKKVQLPTGKRSYSQLIYELTS